MTKQIQMLTEIPFEGFYDSIYSTEIDREGEQFAEYQANEDDSEAGEQRQPAELRLTAGELSEILFRVTDYSAAYHSVARMYVDAFAYRVNEQLGFDLGLKWESMVSPREYNFGTDRLFCHIPQKTVRALFALSKADDHSKLQQFIRGRFTSYDGFASHYDNALESWLDKPLRDWDHNEVGTLLLACLETAGANMDNDESRMSIYCDVCENSGCYQAWSDAVDWTRYDSDVGEARAGKADALREDDPDLAERLAAMPERCPNTLDLFEARPN